MGQKAINPNDMNQQVYYDPSTQQYYTMNRDPIVFKDKSELSFIFLFTPSLVIPNFLLLEFSNN